MTRALTAEHPVIPHGADGPGKRSSMPRRRRQRRELHPNRLKRGEVVDSSSLPMPAAAQLIEDGCAGGGIGTVARSSMAASGEAGSPRPD